MRRKRPETYKAGKKRAFPPIAHHGMTPYLQRFLEWTLVKGYSERTAVIRKQSLRRFILWCDHRDLDKPQEITKPILERYQRHLYHYRKTNGDPLSFSSQHNHLIAIKRFFKWLTKENHILYNPASELELPKLPNRIPRYLLTSEEVERILNQTSIYGDTGVRDRAILETFYSTGIRRMELVNLKLFDVDLRYGSLMVRQGKGNKDRLVPIGERACAWLQKYLDEVRPGLVMGNDEGHLFLTDYGEAFIKDRAGDLVKKYMDAAGIDKPGACHLFRHSMATQMLDNGADIRYIQAILGHSKLSTTEIYTRVSIQKLKAIHKATHPARLHKQTDHNELDQATDAALLSLSDTKP